MKLVLTLASLVLSANLALANQEGAAPAAGAPAATAPATGAPADAATAGTDAGAVKKMSKKEAKTACKGEGKKGKDLKECIKQKTM